MVIATSGVPQGFILGPISYFMRLILNAIVAFLASTRALCSSSHCYGAKDLKPQASQSEMRLKKNTPLQGCEKDFELEQRFDLSTGEPTDEVST
ncbi:hypothetical protein EVAR_47988_1 [Eumeta japonica]|uniref:Uncharacterized protein n=1 Tax=Eumeta variegata TaxID=151549 RepID=A0A4C1XKL1_EUMVA|nr:hypothetical protein EVAR_47988_1 [Eumeta japonica]